MASVLLSTTLQTGVVLPAANPQQAQIAAVREVLAAHTSKPRQILEVAMRKPSVSYTVIVKLPLRATQVGHPSVTTFAPGSVINEIKKSTKGKATK